MVEDEINENAGNRDVKPDRHRPTAETSMSIPAALKNWDEGDDDQRQCDKRKQHVSDQNWKINPGDQAAITRRFFADVQMINDIADEKAGGCNQGDDHARHVALPDVATDPEPTCRNKNSADRI